MNIVLTFDGKFSKVYVEDVVPSALLQSVCIIEHGVDIESQLRFGPWKTDQAMGKFV